MGIRGTNEGFLEDGLIDVENGVGPCLHSLGMIVVHKSNLSVDRVEG